MICNKKTEQYYKLVLKQRLKVISSFPEKFKSFDVSVHDKFKVALAINLTNVIHIKYSLDEEKSELLKDLPKIINLIKDHWQPELVKFSKGRKPIYYAMYWLEYNFFMRKLLSFLVLFDVDEVYFETLRDIIDNDKVKDGLYDYLLSYKFPDRIISENIYPEKPKTKIMDIIFEKDDNVCSKMIKVYLEKEWYKSYKNAGFYNSHLLPEERLDFFGYWAFEVAAIVKIKGIDDSCFRDNMYYPKNLIIND